MTATSITHSSNPTISFMSLPTSAFCSRIRTPSTDAPAYWSSQIPNSSPPHIIPFEATPRSLPFFITVPPASVAPFSAKGILSPVLTLVAAVTICKTSFPTSTLHTLSLSASGCFSIDIISPTTTLLISLPSSITSSTSNPTDTSASQSRFTVIFSKSTKSFSQETGIFILSSYLNCFKNLTSFS